MIKEEECTINFKTQNKVLFVKQEYICELKEVLLDEFESF